MHELSIAQALIEQVETAASNAHALRVARVVIAVGTLSGVDAEALKFLFPLVAEGTVAAGSELSVEQVEARVTCRDCGHEMPAERMANGCATCGSKNVELSAGRELTIKTVELEVDER